VTRLMPHISRLRAGQLSDGLTSLSPDDVLWTRVNTGELMPGVMTPLAWSYYAYGVESGLRQGFFELGMVSASGAAVPLSPHERIVAPFHGRLCGNVNVARQIFSALPGVRGDDVERDLLGSVRAGVVDDVTRREGAMAVRVPRVLLTGRRQARRNHDAVQRLWREAVDGDCLRAGLDPARLLEESLSIFVATLRLQIWMRVFGQAVSAALTSVVEQAGEPAALSTLLAGAAGTEEAKVADDLHRVATGRLPMDRFIADHGYQGPNSGDPAAHVWREDRSPLVRLLPAVANAEVPADRRARAVNQRRQTVKSILHALPAHRRPAARLAIRLAPVSARNIEETKTSMLRAVDVGRAAARALGADLARTHTLSDPEDVFHLFADELCDLRGRDAAEVVAERRKWRAGFLDEEFPETWLGQPIVGIRKQVQASNVTTVTGLGASPGVVEGRVRLVMDAADDVDIDNGDILVCPTTDPSWVSLMTVCAALVVDIGAAGSHGAIVARELGVPCVTGTGNGTHSLCDGDWVRVDGSTGVVEVLQSSAGPARSTS
jgi:pyruvate,water dikinase